MWGKMRARGGHRVRKMNTATNSQSQKLKEKMETQKELGFGRINGVGKYHCCGWEMTGDTRNTRNSDTGGGHSAHHACNTLTPHSFINTRSKEENARCFIYLFFEVFLSFFIYLFIFYFPQGRGHGPG